MKHLRITSLVFIVLFSLGVGISAYASDHIDGPRAGADPTRDIADLFAFPSPERPNHLVVILDVDLSADALTTFSDALNYTLILRRAEVKDDPQKPEEKGFATSDEMRIICTADKPKASEQHRAVQQRVSCSGIGAQPLAAVLNSDTASTGSNDVARLFVGLRSDPSFLDIPMLDTKFTLRESLPTKVNGTNSLQNVNSMSIVIELDVQTLFPGHSLFAVAAELEVRGATGEIVDRMGRAEISNTFLAAPANAGKHDHDTLKDLYNSEATFNVSPANLGRYRDRVFATLFFYDRLDGRLDWRLLPGRMPIVNMLLRDYLVVDSSKPCGKPNGNYLEIERAVLNGQTHKTCGGRRPNDDVISVINTLMVEGLRMNSGQLIVVGTDAPTKWAKSVWPYLVEPN